MLVPLPLPLNMLMRVMLLLLLLERVWMRNRCKRPQWPEPELAIRRMRMIRWLRMTMTMRLSMGMPTIEHHSIRS
jgi:hypothetical protein